MAGALWQVVAEDHSLGLQLAVADERDPEVGKKDVLGEKVPHKDRKLDIESFHVGAANQS